MAQKRSDKSFRFNVSDVVDVPMRGVLLRLRLLDGDPAVKQLAPGSRLRLHGPDSESRVVSIRAKSLTGGRNEQDRLDAAGLMDVIVDTDEAYADDAPVRIGWVAEGPVS